MALDDDKRVTNPITKAMHDDETMPKWWARKHGLNLSSVRNTIDGSKPVQKVVIAFFKEGKYYDLLPAESKRLLPEKLVEKERRKKMEAAS